MAKVKIINGNLDQNLNGSFFNDTPSQTIFSFGKFIVTTNFDNRVVVDYSNTLSSFSREVTLDSLGISKTQSTILLNKNNFDFEFENRIQKELLIKLINDDNLLLKEFLKEIKPLDFDNYDSNFYIKCILNRLTALNLDGELDILYEETDNLEERIEFLDCLGNEDVNFYFDDEE